MTHGSDVNDFWRIHRCALYKEAIALQVCVNFRCNLIRCVFTVVAMAEMN